MPRKGVRKVGTIVHELLHIEVPLHLETDSMTFRAEYGGRTFRDKDGDTVRAAVLKHIEEENVVEWVPVIRVGDVSQRLDWTATDHEWFGDVSGVGMNASRFYLGLVKSGRMLKVEWDRHPEDRIEFAVEAKIMAQHDPSDDRRLGNVREGQRPTAQAFSLPWREQRDPFRHTNRATFLAYSDELWAGLQEIRAVIERERAHLAALIGDTEKFAAVAQLGAAAMQKRLAAPNPEDPTE